jgi:transposase-like protein
MASLTLSEITKVFNDEAAAYELLESLRWPNGAICPHCGSFDNHYIKPLGEARKSRSGKETYRRIWRCHDCKKQFSVLVGTIFGDSHIPVGKWLMAFHLLCAAKNGMSAHELSRQLGVTVKSAWFMAHRIRYAMAQPPLSDKLAGVVEVDETYMGGKAKFMHKAAREQKITGRGGVNKVPVVTLVERGGQARSQVMRTVTGENIGKVLYEHLDAPAVLMTDTSAVYTKAGQAFAGHETVNHLNGEYVRYNRNGGPHAYSNSVEGFFSQLKRSVDGTHHHVSEQHLERYLGEFDYRYNTRKMADADRAELTIRKTAGKRLTYKKPVEAETD